MQTMSTIFCNTIHTEISRAIDQADSSGKPVQFKFNGIVVVVERDSNPDLIYRDWSRAISGYLGESATVGPHPKPTLSPEEIAHDAKIQHATDMKIAEMKAEHTRQLDVKRAILQGALMNAGPIELRDVDSWQSFVEKNQGGYSGRIIRYADEWARLMQVRISNGETIAACAKELSQLADDDGITGFMYGAAIATLAQCWIHGEELRRWHNRETQIGTEGDKANESGGVLNPALLNVGL